MDDNKDKTVKFNPLSDEEIIKKEEIRRSVNDIYSERRKPQNNYPEKRGKDNTKLLLTISVILAVFLLIMMLVTVFLLGKSVGKNEPDNEITNIEETVEPETVEKEEEPKKEAEIVNVCDLVFYGETVVDNDTHYIIKADLYDENFYKTGTRKIKIDNNTNIIGNGKRMSAEGFVYTIESLTGEGFIVTGEIREKDGYAVSLKYENIVEEPAEEKEENSEEEAVEEESEAENNESENKAPDVMENDNSESAVIIE